VIDQCQGDHLQIGKRLDDRAGRVIDGGEFCGGSDVGRFPGLPEGEEELSVDAHFHLRAWRRLTDSYSPHFAYLCTRIEG